MRQMPFFQNVKSNNGEGIRFRIYWFEIFWLIHQANLNLPYSAVRDGVIDKLRRQTSIQWMINDCNYKHNWPLRTKFKVEAKTMVLKFDISNLSSFQMLMHLTRDYIVFYAYLSTIVLVLFVTCFIVKCKLFQSGTILLETFSMWNENM